MGAPRAAAVGGNGAAGGRGAGPKTSSGSALGRESGEGEGVRAVWLTRESLGGSGRGRREGLGVVVERQPWRAARLALGSRGKGWGSALRCDGGEAKTKSASTDGLSGGEWNGDAWNCR